MVFREGYYNCRIALMLSDVVPDENMIVTSSGPFEYSRTFKNVLNQAGYNDLPQVVRSLTDNGKGPTAVDLMSYGACLQQLAVSTGVSVALTDRRDADQIESDRLRGLYVQKNNIFSSRCWTDLRKHADQLGICGYDLLLCRPVGGRILYGDSYVAFCLLKRAYSLLNPEQGILLAQLPILDLEHMVALSLMAEENDGFHIHLDVDNRYSGKDSILIDRSQCKTFPEV